MESKQDKFVRLVDLRLPKILHGIKNLSNLANKNNYEYDEGQAHNILAQVHESLDELYRCFGIDPQPTEPSEVKVTASDLKYEQLEEAYQDITASRAKLAYILSKETNRDN